MASPLTAVMAKLLRLVYAVLTTNKPFDPNHETKRHHHTAPKQTTPAPQTPTEAPSRAVVVPPGIGYGRHPEAGVGLVP